MTVAVRKVSLFCTLQSVVVQSKGSLINVVAKEGGNSARETSSYPKHSYKKNRNYSFVIVGQITKLFLEAILYTVEENPPKMPHLNFLAQIASEASNSAGGLAPAAEGE